MSYKIVIIIKRFGKGVVRDGSRFVGMGGR